MVSISDGANPVCIASFPPMVSLSSAILDQAPGRGKMAKTDTGESILETAVREGRPGSASRMTVK